MLVPEYDELPYRSSPIEWTAPERLALASLLHGGPRTKRAGYRMLELGCGDGTNLLALAYFRRHAQFVGVDGSAKHVELGRARVRELGLGNLHFIHADLRELGAQLEGVFEYVVAHGLISWVPDDVRDAVLALSRTRLADDGLVYLNYNAQPGWSVRGLVRRMLLRHTEDIVGLRARTVAAQHAAAQLRAQLLTSDHPWSQLLAGELGLVVEGEASYIAHEYLAPINRCYWRGELRALAEQHGLEVVTAADFDRASGRDIPELDAWLRDEGLAGPDPLESSDFMRYRQMCSPILAASPWVARPMTQGELRGLRLASALMPPADVSVLPAGFIGAGGQEVEVRDAVLRDVLVRVQPEWPLSLPLDQLFDGHEVPADDLLLLHRLGLLELRIDEPDASVEPGPLHALELRERGELTSAYHRRMLPSGA
ncbi:MAG: class I SAM-dependent methyltransferase [Deltaproteobacteria bacterium]|nr:class I SAM-dependent methyltransferase [Nannocystaceae bacterium]